jgi:hypothetical protein
MTLNKQKVSRTASTAHKNFMGGNSWDINDPFVRLQVAATSCFFGEPAYYVDGDAPQKRTDPAYGAAHLTQSDRKHLASTLNAVDPQEWRGLNTRQLMERAIDEALAVSVERTLQFAVTLRNEWNIRSTSQVIMVRAAMHADSANTGLIGVYANQIMTRLDEVMNQMAYFEGLQGNLKRVPSRLKRAWANRLSQASEYELAKYKLSTRSVNVYDAIRLTHPNSPAIDNLIEGNVNLSNQGTRTWESIRSNGGSWAEATKVMGHMALLRNLRNLAQDNGITDDVLERLKGGVEKGKQLPFRYFSAYRALEGIANGKTLDAVEECLEISLRNAPHFAGRTMSLSDNSGSAQSATTSSMGTMSMASIGNLMSVITGQLSDEGHVGVFGDNLETFTTRKKSSIFDQVQKAEKLGNKIGLGTENGIWLFWANAIKNKEHWDNVFVYSDMQAGHGGLYGTDPNGYRDFIWPSGGRHIDVPKLINTYRTKVNPNVNVFLVQIAGHQDTIVPEFYDRTYILGGWSERLLNFAEQLANLHPSQ